MKRISIAGLDVVLTGGADRDGGGTNTPLVVLLHGYGAPGDDLVPLARVLRAPRETRFAFPAAPLETHMMPGVDSRAWWHIDMLAMQTAMARGEVRDLTGHEPEGLTEAREKLSAVLGEIERTLSPSKIVLGGFSQGSMLALDVALRAEKKTDALVVLSGTLVAENVWVPMMKSLAGVPIFQSHGTHDPILPLVLAEKLNEELSKAGARTTFVKFRGGHEIPAAALEGLNSFLESAL